MPQTATSGAGFPAASALIAETLGEEEEKVVFHRPRCFDESIRRSAGKSRLRRPDRRIVWYNSRAEPLSGANFETDSVAARYVLASGVPVTVVSANPVCPVVVTPALIDSVAPCRTSTPGRSPRHTVRLRWQNWSGSVIWKLGTIWSRFICSLRSCFPSGN